MKVSDDAVQKSVLHLRGGTISRGPGHGLILPPKLSTPEDLRQANLIRASDNFNAGSDETDSIGYYETSRPYGNNNLDHFIKLEPTEKIDNSDKNKSSSRKISQAKRERASFKPGIEKKVAVTSVSVVETGFEHSLLFAYNVPSKTPFETVVISTDSFFDPFYEKNPVGFKVSSGTGQTIKGAYPFLLSSELKRNKLLIPHSFVLTEFDTASTYGKSSSYKSIIGANLNFRDKDTWYPFQGGNVDTKLDFNKYTTIFEKTKFNSFCLSDYSPQIYTVGYADPGALILQTTHLTMSNINSPNTDKVLHIDGKVPTDVAQFRLFEPITTVGTASTAFASVCQIKSNELIVSYSLEEEPRKIFYRIVSNNQVQAKNLLLDLDDLSGNVLNASYNVYGINSFYDKMSNIHKTTFMSNGNIYYHEFDINGSITGNTKTTLIHLIKGDLNDKLASALNNKQLLHKYFDSTSGFASTIPIQRPGITACQKQSYASHTIIAYQTGKCKIEAVLFKPFKDTFVSSREFDIECPNETPGGTTGGGTGGDTGGGTGGDTGGGGTGGDTGGDTGGGTTGGGGGGNNDTSKPNAKFSASPTSGTKDLTVTFTNQSTPFNDLSALSKFKWDFYGDGSDLLETTTLDSFTYVYTRVGTFNPKLIAVDINNIESDVYNLVTITVNDIVNQPPTADFTFQQNTFVSPFSVAFSDTSKDIDGTITSWNWSFGDGNTSTLQNPTNDYQLQGTYNVKLIVTDNLGLSAEISRSVTVAPLPNKPPIPDFTYSQRLNTFTIDFVNNSSDPENDALSYEWTLNEFDTNSKSSLKDPSYTYQVSGIYNVTLKVIDSNSNSATITKQVQVNDVNNLAPNIIDVSYSQTSYVPLTIKFSENSTDTDGYVEQWEWNFGDGSSSVITDPTLKNTTHIYANPGRYIVTLAVTDNGLPIGINKKTTSRTITVIVAPPPPNIPPVASFTVDKNNLPAIFTSTFTDQSTDSDGTIVSWLWELPNNQNIIFDTTNYSKTVLYTFTKSGTYTIKLTVTDNKGTSSTATQDIIVVNQNPSALLTASPNPILSKNTITLDASGSNDIDGNIVNYSWDFGDGVKKLFGSSIENYVYNFPGSYVASVTVTDNLGLQNTALVDIVVQNRNPVAVITYDFLTVKAPNSLNFSGTSSYDEDGRIVRYSWIIINKSLNITYFSSVSSAISVPFTTQGLYTVTLTVTDNLGATNSTSLDVTVTPADNIPPVAVLNVDKLSGTINDTFSFNFRGSNDPDANGSIIRYIINYGDGVEETYSYAPLLVTHRYALPGVYVAKLVVIDNRFGRSLETIDSTKTITINNEPPVANFSVNPTTVFTFENVSLTDLSTDAENSIVKWTWNFGDGSPDLIITDPLLANQTKQYSKGGVDYIITLTVEDNFGLTNTTYKTVTVLNRKPIALIKTDPLAVNNIVTVEQGTTITFTSDSYDLDGIITRYEWYIVGITSAPITTKNFYRSFAARDALYEVTLRVMDDQNLWSDTVSVFVKVQAPNTPPVVYLNANPPSGTATAPVTVFFDSNGTFDPDNPNELLVYFWDFGNGSFSSSPSSSTTYTKAGSYNVFLDVTDRRGSTTQRTLLYVVKDATTGDTTTGGTTSGNLTTGDTTTGGTTTGSTTTGGTTTGDSTTGGNINNTPTAPPADTTPPAPVTNPPIIITGPPANTTPPTTTITTPPTIDWFANPANQVPPASGPIVDPNIQGAE
jgi:PKD repeat protein